MNNKQRVQMAKNLLKKAVKTNDDELIILATDLLENAESIIDPTPAEDTHEDSKVPPEEPNKTRDRMLDVDDFTMRQNKPEGASTQIEVKHQRVNLFTDDGKEHKDVKNETPQIELTERKRKSTSKIQQVCKRCSTEVEVHPTHKREFFVCDKCLKSGSV